MPTHYILTGRRLGDGFCFFPGDWVIILQKKKEKYKTKRNKKIVFFSLLFANDYAAGIKRREESFDEEARDEPEDEFLRK